MSAMSLARVHMAVDGVEKASADPFSDAYWEAVTFLEEALSAHTGEDYQDEESVRHLLREADRVLGKSS